MGGALGHIVLVYGLYLTVIHKGAPVDRLRASGKKIPHKQKPRSC